MSYIPLEQLIKLLNQMRNHEIRVDPGTETILMTLLVPSMGVAELGPFHSLGDVLWSTVRYLQELEELGQRSKTDPESEDWRGTTANRAHQRRYEGFESQFRDAFGDFNRNKSFWEEKFKYEPKFSQSADPSADSDFLNEFIRRAKSRGYHHRSPNSTPGPKPWYEILGIAPTATKAEIRTAYRRLVKKHHPDREGGSNEKMQEINVARDLAMRQL